MSKNLVVKDNALINASYNLELVEQRLILLAIVEARKTGKGITPNDNLSVTASSYMNSFNTNRNTAYQALKDACNNLFERQFSFVEYTDKGLKVVRSRWVSRVAYVDKLAIVELTFAPDVVPLITLLEKHFTSYELEQVAGLNSKYAVRLYEIIIAWRSHAKTPMITIEQLRERLGILVNEYKIMGDFKKRVVDLALKEINAKTDITLTYEQHKNGRKIIGFTFSFQEKKAKHEHIVDIFSGEQETQSKPTKNNQVIIHALTELQAKKYATKLKLHPKILEFFGALKDENAFYQKVYQVLTEPDSVNKKAQNVVFTALFRDTDYEYKS